MLSPKGEDSLQSPEGYLLPKMFVSTSFVEDV